MTEYATYFETMGRKARAASTAMQLADTAVKNKLLQTVADVLVAHIPAIFRCQ